MNVFLSCAWVQWQVRPSVVSLTLILFVVTVLICCDLFYGVQARYGVFNARGYGM